MYMGTINDSSKSNNSKRMEDESSNLEDDTINWYYGLTIFIIIASCAAYVSTITLIPYHDVFVYPSFWWENLIIFGFLYAGLRVTLSLMREIYLVFKAENIMTLRFYSKIFLGTSLGFSIPYCGFYIYWTVMEGNNHPMPFVDLLCHLFFETPCRAVMIWFAFSNDQRKQPGFRRRIKYYLYYYFTWALIAFMEMVMDMIFQSLTAYEMETGMQVQWLMCFVVPIVRGLFEWVLPKVFNKAIGYKEGWTKLDEDEAATFALETQITDLFSLYVAVRLAWASKLTVYCVLGEAVLENLYSCMKIVRLNNKIGVANDVQARKIWKAEQKSEITSLITVETIEIIIPLAYAIAYIMAYYGPNAALMQGVKTTYFGMSASELEPTMEFLFTMFAFDSLGAVLVAIILGLFCRINAIKEYCKVMQKHWITLCLYLSADIFHVSNACMISY